MHGHTIGIPGIYIKFSMHIPQTGFGILGPAFYFDGAGIFGIHSPMGGIDVVCPPAGDHPAAVGITAQPSRPIITILRMHPLFSIIHIRRGAQPHIVVQIGRNRHLRLLSAARVRRQAD